MELRGAKLLVPLVHIVIVVLLVLIPVPVPYSCMARGTQASSAYGRNVHVLRCVCPATTTTSHTA